MVQYTAEDFRKLVNKLNEYTVFVSEEDSVPDDTTEPVDNLMKDPAGAEKVSSGLDADSLIPTLKIPANLQTDFKNAITALQGPNPHFTPGQALAIATAFSNLSGTDAAHAGQHANNSSSVTEAEEPSDEVAGHNTDIDAVQKIIQTAGEVSPVAKLQAIKLVRHIIDGIGDRHKDGGIGHIMTGVVAALESAKIGKEADALKHIYKMVNHVEGDEQAIDGESFPKIVVSLLLLAGDLLQHPQD